MNSMVLSVSQVNMFLKSLIEGDGRLSDVYISGEISNFTNHYKSGHLYFSLKDSKSVIKSVMFAGPVKRLKFMPGDGMKVIVRGRISVYEATGQYQLYAEEMQPDGIGALSIAFEQLKERLENEGLFGLEHKKRIPQYPEKIGVITSATGAALQDILDITKRRWPIAEVLLVPSLVQGNSAAKKLVAAVDYLSKNSLCDVIIIGRGGGSIEDLWAFNNEELARAIFNCEIPIVSAVGHETDFTICDFVSDLRTPTPSAAAELTTPDIETEKSKLIVLNAYFHNKAQKIVEEHRQVIDVAVSRSSLEKPKEFLDNHRAVVSMLRREINKSVKQAVGLKKKDFAVLSGKLDVLSPLKILSRGYGLIYDKDKNQVKDINEISVGDCIEIKLVNGGIIADITEIKGEKML